MAQGMARYALCFQAQLFEMFVHKVTDAAWTDGCAGPIRADHHKERMDLVQGHASAHA